MAANAFDFGDGTFLGGTRKKWQAILGLPLLKPGDDHVALPQTAFCLETRLP
ncbi:MULTISPECIES: hypothetical protein [Rhizobium]|uniref:Uncharacterized protein n=2 Tax=Rhizobium TaxID=379 RepID=A0AAF1KRE0_9HYPH|nr:MULTISPECIES: hypothetical protein [Rhizobium]MBZ5758970.1 hypothetical protein [Rhizobium sp. VS19-DR96]MBZ5764200.1 hypothetical protein [Rhizobium sp. VS19-DR129.2]MBZ5771743.1 hypothetical protein [Rhizobium sp. VS19-DRK62.2]MBZ5783570.1 hypothetical protein [Rhizobium sp. VS19-DR121]MBZ5801756.1 hypothetical protein [Rhizobium sp. VS19-DR181]